jgi:hypothetical protein
MSGQYATTIDGRDNVLTYFGRAMTFRVKSLRAQCSVGVDTVSKCQIANLKWMVDSGFKTCN